MIPHRVIAYVFLEGIIQSGIFYDVALMARGGEATRFLKSKRTV